VRSRLPTGGSSSASTTSTRRCPDRSNGTSSVSSRASPSPAAIAASARSSGSGSIWPSRAHIERRCTTSPRCAALDVWYARLDVDDVARQIAPHASAKQLKRFDRNVAKARAKDSLRAFDRLTRLVDGEPRIVSDPPLIVPIEELASPNQRAALDEAIRRVIRSYRRTLTGDRRRLLERFHYVHAARKVVGVGSVGTRAWDRADARRRRR
jgi:hypothetical protein